MAELQLSHPDQAQLRAFSLGRLDDEAASASISAHLSACADCCRTLESVAGDTLENLVRGADTASLDPAPSLTLPPALLDHNRYQIEERLGAGGMGTVYKARHKLMDRIVALKLVHPRLVEKPGAVERFRQEVRTAARLSHPNIVTAFDAEQAGDQHLLVMEFVPGQSLADVVRARGPLPLATACAYVRQAALGLQHAHERGMVHRDIKPQNLMLTPEGQVKVLDFGLARMARELEPAAALTAAGAVMGTPDYMAPEQADDARQADIRADVYSLGCTLYFLLTGQPPFPSGTFVQKLFAHRTESPRPLSELRAEAPAELIHVLERLLAKDRNARFQTPGEVATALEPFVKAASPQAASTPVARVPGSEKARKRRWPLVATAILVLVGGGILAQQITIRIRDKDGKTIAEVKGDKAVLVTADGKEIPIDPKAPAQPPPAGDGKAAAPPRIVPEPLPPLPLGAPLTVQALVQRPAAIKGVRSWTIDTVGHRGGVYQIAYSPNGKQLASAGEDGDVRIWDVKTSKLVRVLAGAVYNSRVYQDYVNPALSWSRDGTKLATTHMSGIAVWDANTGRREGSFGADGTWGSLVWSKDGKVLFAAEVLTQMVWLREAASGKKLSGLGGVAPALSPDGATLALVLPAKEVIQLHDLVTLKVKGSFAAPKVNSAAKLVWAPNGKSIALYFPHQIAVHVPAGPIRVYEVPSGRMLFDVSSVDKIGSVVCGGPDWTPDSKYVVCGTGLGNGYGNIVLLNGRTGQLFATHSSGWSSPGPSVVCSPKDRVVSYAYRDNGWMPSLLINAADELVWGGPGWQFGSGGNPNPSWLYWSRDGKSLHARPQFIGATSRIYPDAKEYQWEAASGRLLSVSDVTPRLSPDGKRYIKDFEVRDAQTQAVVCKFEAPAGTAPLSFAWSSDETTIAVCRTCADIRLIDAATGKLKKKLADPQGGNSGLFTLAFSPDAKTLGCGSFGGLSFGRVSLLDIESGKVRRALRAGFGAPALAWSPNGKLLAVDSYSSPHTGPQVVSHYFSVGVDVWTGDGQERLYSLPTHHAVSAVSSWSPDSKTLATGSTDAIRLWDAGTGKPQAIVLGPGTPLQSLALSPSGHYRAGQGIEKLLVYVAQLDDGSQVTLTPAEFATKYGWKNDPTKVRLVP